MNKEILMNQLVKRPTIICAFRTVETLDPDHFNLCETEHLARQTTGVLTRILDLGVISRKEAARDVLTEYVGAIQDAGARITGSHTLTDENGLLAVAWFTYRNGVSVVFFRREIDQEDFDKLTK